MGGAPCIAGTRIPIEVILYRLKEGYTLKDLQKMYPWVEPKKFEGALEELASKIGRPRHGQEILSTQTFA